MKPVNLQDVFLRTLKNNGTTVTVFLMSGYQIRGFVEGFDNYTVVIRSDGSQQLIFKHAISTIIPSKSVEIN